MIGLLRAVTGHDGTGAVWSRLTQAGWQVVRFAYAEARALGHPVIAGEHLLLGVLRHGDSHAATLLAASGLDLATARAELLRVGPALRAGADPAGALGALGVDVDEVRQRLSATFGVDALDAAERRVRRRPRWRGGHARPRPVCVHLLANRALVLAARQVAGGIGPDQLLYGVLKDARAPLGTGLGRRAARKLAPFGFRAGRPNPVRLQLEARGIDLAGLAARLASQPH